MSSKEVLKIPVQLKTANFVLLGGDDGKKPIELGWQKKDVRLNNPNLIKHLNAGKNYGVRCGSSSPVIINGVSYSLIGVDFDSQEMQDACLKLLPETFTVKTGGKGLFHLYFATDGDESYKIFNEKKETLCDIQAEGKQLVGPRSKNAKTGRSYEIVKDIPIAYIPYSELKAILTPFDKSPKKAEKPKKDFIAKGQTKQSTDEIINAISMKQVLEEIGVNTSKELTGCPFHSSSGGKCFSWNDQTAHCFHCDGSWNRYSILREAKKLTDKECFEWFADKGGNLDKLKKSRKEFVEEKIKTAPVQNSSDIFSYIGQAEHYIKSNPIYYDINKIFWSWNKERFCWEMTDETSILNGIRKSMSVDTIEDATPIIMAIKQVAREKKPKTKPKHWIQFLDSVVDVKTGEKIKATSDYFLTNPFPWKLGSSSDTPTIDRLFNEWVVKEGIQDSSYVRTLQEVSAYGLTDDLFMQRWIAMTGAGSNGKGTWSGFMKKLVGKENHVSIQLKKLAENRFSVSDIYRKPVAFCGEVSYGDLSNTNTLKMLTGEDSISYEFKGKNAFTDDSITTMYVLTNSLPSTPDKSIGFYRRCLILDFPNQFEINPDILTQIPDQEYENFCLKCVQILKELYSTKRFTNEGTIQQREERYEDKSNPLPKFIDDHCEEELGEVISLQDFSNQFNAWLKLQRLRILNVKQVGAMLRMHGYQIGKRKNPDKTSSITGIINLGWNKKTTETTETTQNENDFLRVKTSLKVGSLGSLGSQKELNSCKKCNSYDIIAYPDLIFCNSCKHKELLAVIQ